MPTPLSANRIFYIYLFPSVALQLFGCILFLRLSSAEKLVSCLNLLICSYLYLYRETQSAPAPRFWHPRRKGYPISYPGFLLEDFFLHCWKAFSLLECFWSTERKVQLSVSELMSIFVNRNQDSITISLDSLKGHDNDNISNPTHFFPTSPFVGSLFAKFLQGSF